MSRGRGITAADITGAPAAAVVNETFARRMWPGEDPIGRRITAGQGGGDPMEVVGVLRDIPPFRAGNLQKPRCTGPLSSTRGGPLTS